MAAICRKHAPDTAVCRHAGAADQRRRFEIELGSDDSCVGARRMAAAFAAATSRVSTAGAGPSAAATLAGPIGCAPRAAT